MDSCQVLCLDVIDSILTYCDIFDVINCKLVSKKWKIIISKLFGISKNDFIRKFYKQKKIYFPNDIMDIPLWIKIQNEKNEFSQQKSFSTDNRRKGFLLDGIYYDLEPFLCEKKFREDHFVYFFRKSYSLITKIFYFDFTTCTKVPSHKSLRVYSKSLIDETIINFAKFKLNRNDFQYLKTNLVMNVKNYLISPIVFDTTALGFIIVPCSKSIFELKDQPLVVQFIDTNYEEELFPFFSSLKKYYYYEEEDSLWFCDRKYLFHIFLKNSTKFEKRIHQIDSIGSPIINRIFETITLVLQFYDKIEFLFIIDENIVKRTITKSDTNLEIFNMNYYKLLQDSYGNIELISARGQLIFSEKQWNNLKMNGIFDCTIVGNTFKLLLQDVNFGIYLYSKSEIWKYFISDKLMTNEDIYEVENNDCITLNADSLCIYSNGFFGTNSNFFVSLFNHKYNRKRKINI